MMTGTIVQTCVLFFIVYRTNWNKEVNFFSHLFYVYVASNEIHFTPKKRKKKTEDEIQLSSIFLTGMTILNR